MIIADVELCIGMTNTYSQSKSPTIHIVVDKKTTADLANRWPIAKAFSQFH